MLPKLMDAITSEYTTQAILENLIVCLNKRITNSNTPAFKSRVFAQIEAIEAALKVVKEVTE